MAAVYDNTLAICQKYLSGDAQRFLDRQISAHLKKTPEALLAPDKEELGRWCRISGALLLGKDKAEQLESEILSI